MEFKIIEEKHNKTVEELWAYCFESHEPFFSWYFREYYQRENTLGAIENGRLLSCLQLIPYQILLREQQFNTSYIVGVASLPEARGGGLVKQLMVAALQEMDKRRQAVALLMPFKGQFYYPYQWSFCYYHYKYKLKLAEVKAVAEPYGGFIPLETNENLDSLQNVYNLFVKDKNGYVVRNEKNWRLLLEEHIGEKGYTYILENEGTPQGYIMYYLKDNKFIVREMAYTNYKAQKALFQFIYNHSSQVDWLDWQAPIDDYTHMFLPDPKEVITLYPFLMARIVNVRRALTSISYPHVKDKSLIIKLEDKLAAWNNKTFKLEIDNGQAQVKPSGNEPEVTLSIDALSQLFFGAVGAGELYYQGRIQTTSDTAIATLDGLFPKCNNYINEYY